MNQEQKHDPSPGYNLGHIRDPSLENDPRKDLPCTINYIKRINIIDANKDKGNGKGEKRNSLVGHIV